MDENMIEERNYTQEIFDLIRKTKNSKLLAQTLTDYHDNDIADALTYLTPDERKRLYKAIGVEATSRIFAYLDEDVDKYFAELENETAADILEEMDADDAVDILEALDKEKADEIISLVEPEMQSDIQLIKSYDDNEFGSLMTTNFISIPYGLGVRKSIDTLIEEAEENDNIETIYITKDGKFYGALTLRDLLITKKDEELDEKIILSYPFVFDKEEITEEAIDDLADYSEDSFPVLNKDREILGVITAADIVELFNEEEEEEETEAEVTAQPVQKEFPFDMVAFALILLVAVNRIMNVVNGNAAVEGILVLVAVVLEAYSIYRKRTVTA